MPEIETGIANNERVEVKSGLSGESQVITTWASQLKDNVLVEVKGSEEGSGGKDTKTGDVQTQESEEAGLPELSDTQKLNFEMEARITQSDADR